ncbi:hypothetical protein JB92DRAFT_3007061 [Gautieria morchelliformis]|nr:hypothetical protein JB92DRAFT_3007061 [Gautieria morchelliformis]
MLFTLLSCVLALFAGCGRTVTARSDSFIPSLSLRQVNASAIAECNARCANFQALRANCTTPHCGCTVSYLSTQGNCLQCQTGTPQDAATVQILLDTEIYQCRMEGIKVEFQLDLPPAAAAIVEKFHRDSAFLRRSQTAFLTLQVVGGQIGMLVILVFAVFSRKVSRGPAFLNFCITWIFSSVIFSILLYRGTDGNTVINSLGEVSQNICLAQAALTEGAQVMTACSTLALVIQLWLTVRESIHGDSLHGIKQNRWMTCALVVTPYILFIAFSFPSVVVGMDHIVVNGSSTERAIPANFYCTVIQLNSFVQAVYGATLTLLMITMVFDVLIIRVLYVHWIVFRSSDYQAKSVVPVSILLRVMLFSFYRVVMAVTYGAIINMPPEATVTSIREGETLSVNTSIPIWVDLLQAAIPLVGFLALGVSRDMINSFMFWRRLRSSDSPLQSDDATGVSTLPSAWHEKWTIKADAIPA